MTSVALATLVTMHLLNNFLLCVHFYIVIEILSSFYRLLMKFRSYRKWKNKIKQIQLWWDFWRLPLALNLLFVVLNILTFQTELLKLTTVGKVP